MAEHFGNLGSQEDVRVTSMLRDLLLTGLLTFLVPVAGSKRVDKKRKKP
jgi:hypothetical protein